MHKYPEVENFINPIFFFSCIQKIKIFCATDFFRINLDINFILCNNTLRLINKLEQNKTSSL